MGKSANRAKTKWNASRYKQVKVSIAPDIAIAFKFACEAAELSMASEISKFMSDYCAIAKKKSKTAAANDLSTRSKRCKKVSEITRLMEQVRDAETISHENVPENLRGASTYEDAEDSLSRMDEVIDLLETIY